jgi:hypothetical protein
MAFILGYANQVDDAPVSGGSWSASYPLTNIKTRYLFQRARSTDALASSSTMVIDTGENQTIGVVALVRHNISTNGTVRIRGYEFSNLTGLAYDSGAVTVYAGEDFAHAFTPTAARYWQIVISDTGNADAYIEIGRVFIGWRFEPEVCADWGLNIGVESQTTVMQSLAGPEFFDSRPNRRIVTGQWSWLTQAEAHGVYLSILREQDVEKEVYAIFDPDTQFPDQCWFLGRFRTLNAIEWPYLDRHSVGFEISEVL